MTEYRELSGSYSYHDDLMLSIHPDSPPHNS